MRNTHLSPNTVDHDVKVELLPLSVQAALVPVQHSQGASGEDDVGALAGGHPHHHHLPRRQHLEDDQPYGGAGTNQGHLGLLVLSDRIL